MALTRIVNDSIEGMNASKLTGSLPDGMGDDFTKSTSNPTATTNGTLGELYLNTTSGEIYSCTDATTNANVWTNVGDGTGQEPPIPTSSATGGTITTDGDFKVHTFNSSDTFTVSDASGTFELLLIAGGGSAGGSDISTGYNNERGGGGGAGGYRYFTDLSLSSTNYTITIGGGGARVGLYLHTSGTNSSALTYSATGGGSGGISRHGSYDAYWAGYEGNAGGSGGGAMGTFPGAPGGAGNLGGYTPVEGYAGGSIPTGTTNAGKSSGGGGSGGLGTYVTTGGGGPGTASTITGSSVTRASGGQVANNTASGAANSGDGGSSGINTSGSGAGGSGVVIIRYKFQ